MMNRWINRALMAPETGAGSADATGVDAASSSTASAPAGAEGTSSTATSPSATGDNAATAVDNAASAATVAESTLSLISAADGKPKAETKVEAPTPSDTPAPAPEAKPDAKADTPEPSSKDAKEPAKPDDPGKTEGKAEAATDPAKEATATQPPALVSLEDLKLPENVKLADEPAKAFLDLINKADLPNKERTQGLIDLHIGEINRVADEAGKYQRKVWDDLNTGWKSDLRNDPELGGNRLNTSLSMAKAVIEEYGGSKEQQAALFKHIDNNGMGNYPEFVRLLHNIGRKLNIFEDSIVPSNAKAPTMPKGPGQRGWYDKSLNASGS